MGRSTARGAIVGITIALVYLLSAWVMPEWGVSVLCVTAGLIAAGLFARLYLREPPSLDRFRWLSAYGLAAVSGVVLGTLYVLTRLPIWADLLTKLFVLLAAVLLLFVGLLVFVIWHWLAVQRYSAAKPPDPDFAEDAEGNPVRPRGREGGPGTSSADRRQS